jgi:hypothetical protein
MPVRNTRLRSSEMPTPAPEEVVEPCAGRTGSVRRLDLGRGARHGRLDIALTARNGARALRCTLELPDDVRRAEGRVRALVPLIVERREAFLRCPHMVGDDSHRIVEAHHLTHALDHHRLAVVDALHATAKDW